MSLRVASFDIGIRNMAYCVFSIDTSSVSISDWGVINMLSDAPSSAPVCEVVLEKKSKKTASQSSSAPLCGKKAKFHSPSGIAATTCFCAMHAAKHGTWILPQKEHSLAYLRKQKAEAIQSIYQSLFLLEPVERIRQKTKPVLMDEIHQWYEKTCFRPIVADRKKKTSNDTDLITIGRTMRDRLDAIDAFRGVTHVVIENQISPIATRMKTVQGMLTQYFLMREKCADGGGAPIDVEYVSSCNKLKGFVPATTDVTSQKDKYKQHKADSVRICTEMVRENFPESVDILSTSTKKDDLADCFLQGIWYLQRENIITYAENLKINIVRLS
jgi:hypothetical protein